MKKLIIIAFVLLMSGVMMTSCNRSGAPRTDLGKLIDIHCEEHKISGGILVYTGVPDKDLLTDLATMAGQSFPLAVNRVTRDIC